MREFMAFFAGLVILTALWFFKEIFLGFDLCFMDLFYYFHPYRHFMVESIRNFSFPFWNPYIYFGFPFFAALQHGLLYPLSVIYFILPFDAAFNLFLIVHYPLAAVFMYMYLWHKGRSFWARAVGSVSFSFSGYLLFVLFMPTTLAAVTWLPLALMFHEKLMDREKWAFPALLIVLSLIFLGGEPTIFYSIAVMLFIYSWFFPGGYRNAGKVALNLVLVAALLAVQIFPFIELVLRSVRAGGLSYYEATQWSMSPQRVIEFFIPFFYHLTSVPWASLLWLKSMYMGIIPIVLLPAAFFMPDKRSKRFLVLVLLFGLVLAMGKYTPIYRLLFNFFPGFSGIRYPAKFLFLATFSISALSAYGYDLIVENTSKLGRYHLMVFAAGSIFVLVSCLGILHPKLFYALLRPLYFEEIKAGFEYQILAMNMRNVVNFGISGVFLLGAGAVIFLAKRTKKAMLFIVPLMLFDLALSNYGLNFSAPADLLRATSPNLEIVKKDRSVFRVLASPDMVKRELKEISDEMVNYRIGLVSINDRLPVNRNMLYRIECCQGYESIHGADAEIILSRIYSIGDAKAFRALDAMNIKYLVAAYPIKVHGCRMVSIRPEYIRGGKIYLYENQNALPRRYEVRSFKVFADREKLLDLMFSGEFNPKNEVLLEQEPGKFDRLLYVSDPFYPGWKAYVDGKERKIFRANYMFRAVPLYNGERSVEFVYDPVSFKAGLMVSVLTLFGMLICVIVQSKREPSAR